MVSSEYLETIVREVLPIPLPCRSSITRSSFLQLGFDSLLLASFEARIHQEFGWRYGSMDLSMTIVDLEKLINKKNGIAERRRRNQSITRSRLSWSQKLILIETLKDDRSVFDEEVRILFKNLDFEALKKSWWVICHRHPILRSSVTRGNLVYQSKIVEITKGKPSDYGSLLEDGKIPLRVYVEDNTAFLQYHHILLDGKSLKILLEELILLYNGEYLAEEIQNPTYYDFCLFEEKFWKERELTNNITFWKNHLRQETTTDPNNNEFGQNIPIAGGPCGTFEYPFTSSLSAQLREKLRRFGVSTFSFHVAVSSILIGQLFRLPEVILGFPVDLRLSPEFEKTVGFFLNQLVIKTKPTNFKTFVDYLKHVYCCLDEIKAHSLITYDVIQREANISQPNFLVIDDKITSLPEDIKVQLNKTTTNHLLILHMRYDNNDFRCISADYHKKMIPDYTVRLLLDSYIRICEEFVGNTCVRMTEINICTPLRENEIHVEDFLSVISTRCQALPPGKVLIKDENTEITVKQYSDMVCKLSNMLSSSIKKTDAPPVIVILMDRTVYLPIMVVSLWKSGFIPIILDKTWPNPEIKYAIEVSKPLKVLTDDYTTTQNAFYVKDIIELHKDDHADISQGLSDGIYGYFSFTSGSTGTPKLIKSPRISLSNMLYNYLQIFDFNEESVVYQVVNPAFDIFYADILISLASGSTLFMAKGAIPSWKEIADNHITHAYIMPTFLNNLADRHFQHLSRLHLIQFGGERISPRFIERALQFNVKLCQLFGFTEHAIYTNYQWIKQVVDIDYIGIPFDNTATWCLDSNHKPVPYNKIGYLFTTGMGLSEDDQSGRYAHSQGRNMYKTGDLCEFTTRGIRYIGRSDDCEKVRGHMINPSDVDRAIERTKKALHNITVILEEDGQNVIVSYVKVKHPKEIDELRADLNGTLKRHMVPNYIIWVEEFPLNPNGKVDKRKLKANFKENMHRYEDVKETSTNALINIFRETFGPGITMNSNLYEYGVDSLKLLSLMNNLEEHLNIPLDYKQIMNIQTPKEFIDSLNYNTEHIKPTFNQEHIWLLRDVNPDVRDFYWIKVNLNFYDVIHKEQFKAAVNYIIQNNESLQYIVALDDNGLYLKRTETDTTLLQYTFTDEKTVAIKVDHMAVDGYSLKILTNLLAKCYLGKEEDNVASPSFLQYARDIQNKDMTKSRDYWVTQLEQIVHFSLPVEFECSLMPKHAVLYDRMTVPFSLNTTMFQTIILALVTQIHEESQLNEFIVGIPVLNRNKDNMNMIAYLANTLPVKFRYFQDTEKLLKDVKETLYQMTTHSDYPLQFLKRDLRLKSRDIIQRMVSYEDFHINNVDGLFTVQEVEQDYLKFEQCWQFLMEDKVLHLKLEYDGNKFSENYIKRQIETFKDALHHHTANTSLTNKSNNQKETITLEEKRNIHSDNKEKILQIYRLELQNDDFTVTDNFFDFGGHSFAAAKISSKIRKTLSCVCPTKYIFQYQTVNELIRRLFTSGDFKDISFLEKSLLNSMERAPPSIREAYYHHIHVNIEDVDLAKALLITLINTQDILRTEFVKRNGEYQASVQPKIESLVFPYSVKSSDIDIETVNIDVKSRTLIIRLHHICADGYSMKIMQMTLLNEKIKTHSVDHLRDLLKARYNRDQKMCLQYWTTALTHPAESLFKDKLNTTATKLLSCTVERRLLADRLKHERVSYNTLFMYCLHHTLSHWTVRPEDNIYIAMVKDCRDEDVHDVMGHFVQILPITRCNNIHDMAQNIERAEECCYFDVSECIAVKNVNIQAMLVFSDEPNDKEPIAKYPMTFFVTLNDHQVHINCVYMDYWNEETIMSILNTFSGYLRKEEIPSLPYTTEEVVLTDPVIQIVKRCEEYKEKIALQTPTSNVTYGELYRTILRISKNIQQWFILTYGENITSDTIICLSMDRRVDAIIAILGTLLTGAAYLFVDPDTSQHRINQMLDRAHTRMLISTKDVNHPKLVNYSEIIDDYHQYIMEGTCHASLSDLCYTIYTSGSTGTPKMVGIERRSLANTLYDATQFMGVDNKSVIYQFTKLCFDNSVLEIFLALTNGATLFVDDEIFSSEEFVDQIHKHNITHAFLFPGLVSTFADNEIEGMALLDYWIVGAEPLTQQLLDKALSYGLNIIQNYGPTETTCYALRRKMKTGDRANNLGLAVINTRCMVVNDAHDTVPSPALGAPRELLIGGSGVMRGYLGIVDQPYVVINNHKYYKSGDMARLSAHGDVLFCGRLDAQVKVRGFRIDLRELENVIGEINGILNVIATVEMENIYVYYQASQVILPVDIRDYCKERVASYAIPARYIQVDKIPLTANNKVNKERLKGMNTLEKDRLLITQQVSHLPEGTEGLVSKEKIGHVWKEVLSYENIRYADGFFDVGGNSLTAFKLLNMLRDVNVALTFPEFLEDPTINGIFHRQRIPAKICSPAENDVGLLSYQQEQMYFFSMLNDDYNLIFVQIFNQKLNVKQFEDSINKVISKNKILRTKYIILDDAPVQSVLSEHKISLRVEDCTEAEIKQNIKIFSGSKLSMADIPVMMKIYKSEDKFYFLFLMNHILTDATTTRLLEEKISSEYNGLDSTIPVLDYIDWAQRERTKERTYKELAKDFKVYYNNIKNGCYLHAAQRKPISFLRAKRSYKHVNTLGGMFATFITLIAKAIITTISSGRKKLLIGSPYHNRESETAQTLGNFLNNIVIAAEYDSNRSFEENVMVNNNNIREALKFSCIPYTFLKQVDPFNDLFQVYVNCRYNLEDEKSLKMDCAVPGGVSFIDPIKHFPAECHIDNIDDEIVVEWLIDDNLKHIIAVFDEDMKRFQGDYSKKKLRKILEELLNHRDFNDHQQFFEIGGNSIQLIRLKHKIKKEINVDISLGQLMKDCSVNSILSITSPSPIKVLNKGKTNVLVLFHSIVGVVCYQKLTQKLLEHNDNLTILLVDIDDNVPSSLEALAQKNGEIINSYLSANEAVTINLAGFSFGGILAFETGQRLRFPYQTLISIDGIGHSEVVNANLTFEAHQNQIKSVGSQLGIDEYMGSVVNVSWQLLDLAKRHKLNSNIMPCFDRFELIRTERKNYGWPFIKNIIYGIKTLPCSHMDLLNCRHQEVALIIQKLF